MKIALFRTRGTALNVTGEAHDVEDGAILRCHGVLEVDLGTTPAPQITVILEHSADGAEWQLLRSETFDASARSWKGEFDFAVGGFLRWVRVRTEGPRGLNGQDITLTLTAELR